MAHTNVRPELVAVGEGPQGVVLSVLAYPEAGHGLMHLGVLRIVLERLIHESLALALRILLEAAHNKERNNKEEEEERSATASTSCVIIRSSAGVDHRYRWMIERLRHQQAYQASVR